MSVLPTPVSLSKQRRVFRRNLPTAQRRTLDLLLTRSRVTNLGILILSLFAAISFLYNLSFYFSRPYRLWNNLPIGINSTLSRPKFVHDLNHLIIVPGHSIWRGSDPNLKLDEDEWLLESYQKGGGRISAFVNHIAHG